LEGFGTLFGELTVPDIGTYFTPWYGGVVHITRGIGDDGSKFRGGFRHGVVPDPNEFVAVLSSGLRRVAGNVVAVQFETD
jgi:hypothetical protein